MLRAKISTHRFHPFFGWVLFTMASTLPMAGTIHSSLETEIHNSAPGDLIPIRLIWSHPPLPPPLDRTVTDSVAQRQHSRLVLDSLLRYFEKNKDSLESVVRSHELFAMEDPSLRKKGLSESRVSLEAYATSNTLRALASNPWVQSLEPARADKLVTGVSGMTALPFDTAVVFNIRGGARVESVYIARMGFHLRFKVPDAEPTIIPLVRHRDFPLPKIPAGAKPPVEWNHCGPYTAPQCTSWVKSHPQAANYQLVSAQDTVYMAVTAVRGDTLALRFDSRPLPTASVRRGLSGKVWNRGNSAKLPLKEGRRPVLRIQEGRGEKPVTPAGRISR